MCVNTFSSQTTRPTEAKFHVEPPFDWGTKICSNGPGHTIDMGAIPIYGKNIKKPSSLEPKGWWPWNLVCSIKYYQVCLNDDPWVDLDLFFYGKVKFAPSCVCMGTYFNINIRFPRNCWHIKSTKWVPKAKVIDPFPRLLRFHQFQTFISNPTGSIELKFHVEPPWEAKICSYGPCHMTKMATMPI